MHTVYDAVNRLLWANASPITRSLLQRKGLTMWQAATQAECERRPFSWIDTRTLCTFKCRCEVHETNSVTNNLANEVREYHRIERERSAWRPA